MRLLLLRQQEVFQHVVPGVRHAKRWQHLAPYDSGLAMMSILGTMLANQDASSRCQFTHTSAVTNGSMPLRSRSTGPMVLECVHLTLP